MKYEQLGIKKSYQVIMTADFRVHDLNGTLSIDFLHTFL